MKATDLMIGDLVTYTGDDEGPITASIEGINEDSDFGIEILGTCERIEDIEPIPITAEILETNGWVFCDDCEYVSPFDVGFKTGLRIFGFGEYYDEGRFAVNIGHEQLRNNLKYVHELQNLIRSLGMSEIANNFKIV